MIAAPIHPKVRDSFRPDGHGGYFSRNGGGFISCPPYVIAAVAASRVQAGTLELPEGYDTGILERVKAITGWTDRDVCISGRQAGELAQIGRQILALPESAIEPPLGYFERQAVEHLVRVAGDPQ